MTRLRTASGTLGLLLVVVSLGDRGSQTAAAEAVKGNEAVLEMEVAADARVSIDGKEQGKQRRFVYGEMEKGEWQKHEVEVTLRGGQRVKRLLLLRGGWRVRLPIPEPNKSRPELVVQTGHTDGIGSVSYSPDGKHIVTGSWDKTAIVWDAATGTKLRALSGHTGSVISVSYSPDGKHIVTGSGDKTAILWDAVTGTRVRALSGHTGGISSVSCSPNGKHIVTGSHDKTAIVWEAATGKRVRTLSKHTGGITSVCYSSDGKHIVTGSWDKTAIVWDAATGTRLRTLSEHTSWVTSVSYSPDGKHIVTGSDDKTAILWEAATGDQVTALSGHTVGINSVGYSRDGKHIVTGSWDRTAIVWDAATGARFRVLSAHRDSVNSARFSPDGKHIVTGSRDKTAIVWDAVTGTRLRALSGQTAEISAVSASRDGKHIVTGSGDAAIVWEAATGTRVRAFSNYMDLIKSVTYSPDGKHIVAGDDDDTASVWEAATGRRVHFLSGHSSEVTSASYSPNGRHIVTGSWDKTAIVWNAGTGKWVRTLTGHTSEVTSVSFSPDSKHIVTCSWDKTAIMWNAGTGKRVRTLTGHTSGISSVSYSPDGKHIVTGSWDKTAIVWNAGTGKWVRTLTGHTNGISSVSYSPDGKHIVTGSYDNTAIVWEAATGARVRSLSGHTNSITSVSCSPSGRHIFTSSQDGTVVLWDMATGDVLVRLISLKAGTDWLVFTPEGLFDGSAGGREKVSYRVGMGLTVVPVDRFFQDFYRPGLLAAVWKGDRTMPEVDFAKQRPPTVRIVSPKEGGSVEKPAATLEVEATDEGGGVQGPWLFHNGTRVLAQGEVERKGKVTKRTFTVSLVEGENQLEVRAASLDGSWESEPARLVLRYTRPLPKPELYVVAIGVSKYAQSGLSLEYAAADARAVAQLFEKRGRALYKDVHVSLLLDENATREKIAKAFADIKSKARPQDTLLVFLAGHGRTVGQRYYFIPHEFRRIKDSTLEADVRKQGLSHDVLADHLTAVPALKRILVFDTCASGSALGVTKTARNPFALRGAIERLARNQGVYALAATAAHDDAKEVKELGHGLLTYALLAGLKAVDKGPLEEEWIRPASAEGVVDVLEWFTFAAGRVPRLARKYFGKEQEVEQRAEGRSFPVLPLK